MPLGLTEKEFAQFTKTERKILQMVDAQIPREEIPGKLEITDSTFRVHLANIRRKQAVMRVARSQIATRAEEERLKAHFLPEMTEGTEKEETKPLPFVSLHRSDPPPLEHVAVLAPMPKRGADPFVTVPSAKEKSGGRMTVFQKK